MTAMWVVSGYYAGGTPNSGGLAIEITCTADRIDAHIERLEARDDIGHISTRPVWNRSRTLALQEIVYTSEALGLYDGEGDPTPGRA